MTRVFMRASVAASLLLPALAGCVFHKTSPPPVAAIAPTPEPAPAPLYSAELSSTTPSLPQLPGVTAPNAQPAPPPTSVIEIARKQHPAPVRRSRSRRGETETAERETREREKETASNESSAPAANTNTADATVPVEKVTAPTPTGDTTQPTPIGQLTAGPSQDADASKNQAFNLITNTQRGVNSLRHTLSSDQEKTVAQIRSFLIQAQRAIHNGDVDGAYTLATKAKLLLDELNGTT